MGVGIPPQEKLGSAENESHTTNSSPIPPVRRLAKSFSVATSSSTSSNVHKGTFHKSRIGHWHLNVSYGCHHTIFKLIV